MLKPGQDLPFVAEPLLYVFAQETTTDELDSNILPVIVLAPCQEDRAHAAVSERSKQAIRADAQVSENA